MESLKKKNQKGKWYIYVWYNHIDGVMISVLASRVIGSNQKL
jgi:hypothetical protein